MTTLGKIITDTVKRTIPVGSQRGIVIGFSGPLVSVNVDGAVIRSKNATGTMLLSGDVVSLMRVDREWNIIAVENRVSTQQGNSNPRESEILKPVYKFDYGGDAGTYSSSDVGSVVTCSDAYPFRSYGGRILFMGHLSFNPSAAAQEIRGNLRVNIDDFYYGPYVEVRIYMPSTVRGWLTYSAVVGGVPPGGHAAEMEMSIFNYGGAGTITIATDGVSVTEL